MTIKNRTAEEQQLLNSHMRRKDVLEWALFQSLHAEPASQEQVKRFLATAPPEVFVLLDGLRPPPSTKGFHDEPIHENRIVQGFVSMAMARRKSDHPVNLSDAITGLDPDTLRLVLTALTHAGGIHPLTTDHLSRSEFPARLPSNEHSDPEES